MRSIFNFFAKLGLFKSFFLVVLPLTFAFFCITSLVNGTLSEDIGGYLIGFGSVAAVVTVVSFLARKTR